MPVIHKRILDAWSTLDAFLLASIQGGYIDPPPDIYNAIDGLNYYFRAPKARRRCSVCREREAVWAKQYIGSDAPEYYRLGYHIRGFPVVKLCEECKQTEALEHGDGRAKR
jgi:hypothetical protein